MWGCIQWPCEILKRPAISPANLKEFKEFMQKNDQNEEKGEDYKSLDSELFAPFCMFPYREHKWLHGSLSSQIFKYVQDNARTLVHQEKRRNAR